MPRSTRSCPSLAGSFASVTGLFAGLTDELQWAVAAARVLSIVILHSSHSQPEALILFLAVPRFQSPLPRSVDPQRAVLRSPPCLSALGKPAPDGREALLVALTHTTELSTHPSPPEATAAEQVLCITLSQVLFIHHCTPGDRPSYNAQYRRPVSRPDLTLPDINYAGCIVNLPPFELRQPRAFF